MSYSGGATAFSVAATENPKPSKPPTTYKPSSSANGDVDHGKRQHELQLNFKVKIHHKSTQKPLKLDPILLQDRIALNDDAEMENQFARLEQASVPELKELLRERGLPVIGKKNELVERLMARSQRITPLSIAENLGGGGGGAASPTGSPKVKSTVGGSGIGVGVGGGNGSGMIGVGGGNGGVGGVGGGSGMGGNGAGSGSPRYSPYSGSLSPRYQDRLSPRLVSGLSINAARDSPDASSRESHRLDQDFVAPPLLHSPTIESRPRAHSIEPANHKAPSRRVSSDSSDLGMKKAREKVMGRSSSTSELPLWKAKALQNRGEVEHTQKQLPRAQSSELYPTVPLHGYLYPNALDSIVEGHLESASSHFYQDTKKQYPVQVMVSSAAVPQGAYDREPFDMLDQSISNDREVYGMIAHHQMAYSGIPETQYLVGQEISSPPLPADPRYRQASGLPYQPASDAYSLGVRSSSEGHDFADEGYQQDYYLEGEEEPGYIMKKDNLIDFQLPSHELKYQQPPATFQQFYGDSSLPFDHQRA